MLSSDPSIDKAVRVLWDYMHLDHPLVSCDIILLLGNRDARTAVHAARLYSQGLAPTILVSGGVSQKNDNVHSISDQTEAQRFAEIMCREGVPRHSILCEEQARNTGENIILSYGLLQSLGLKPRSIMLVQKPYMERRVYATFMKQWPGASQLERVLVTSPRYNVDEWFSQKEDFVGDVSVMVGDAQRMSEYARRGYQIPQAIPREVTLAVQYLAKQGFNKHILQQ